MTTPSRAPDGTATRASRVSAPARTVVDRSAIMVRDENNGGGDGRPTDVLSHYLNRRLLGGHLDGALDYGTARATAAQLATCWVGPREADGRRRLRAPRPP